MPVIRIDFVCVHSERETEDEKGTPIEVMRGEKTQMITAKVEDHTEERQRAGNTCTVGDNENGE